MKIRIKNDDHNLNFWFPTGLIFGKTAVRIANKLGRKYAPDALKGIPPEALERICSEMRHIKDRYGMWELVDIESADGEIVKIIL